MSLFDPRSELSWVNAHAAAGPVQVEPGLFALLEHAQAVHRETDGAFDVTVGPLMRCWRHFRQAGVKPSDSEVQAARQSVGMQHVRLDPDAKAVAFDREGVVLDLGGIAKGYAVDRVAERLREAGVRSALVHGGWSTAYALGHSPDDRPWPLGIRHPHDPDRRLCPVEVADAALSTSGSYERFVEVEGVRYSHLLDPRTGQPVQGMLSASALTQSATAADALSTAFFVLGVDRTRAYCAAHPGTGALLAPDPGPGHEPQIIGIGSIP
jgi:thiamine biosynthesis lipoprotein